MVDLLSQYFIENRKLELPGLGRLEAGFVPPRFDGVRNLMFPPYYSFHWSPAEKDESFSAQGTMGYLSRIKQWTEEESYEQMQSFCLGIKIELEEKGEWAWPGLGKWVRMAGGKTGFVPDQAFEKYNIQIPATAALRERQVHSILVGDRQTNSYEMQQGLIVEPEQTEAKWWLPALIIGLTTVF